MLVRDIVAECLAGGLLLPDGYEGDMLAFLPPWVIPHVNEFT